eukprot:TRINITY_DN3247_c0_g1_i1.p1 TRINITY_DN3247_c0_g1~~TRINITY_DN3247_c0_g1_i1.p1  ORF type:complete len:434 (+),score=145.03 TRINITY_DN3247_c0_g1_i1:103-1302(+)
MSEPVFWLISVPPMPTREQSFTNVNEKTSHRSDLSVNYKFSLPQLKVGTLDSLMSLSDDLIKIDQMVESTTRKIGQQLMALLSDANQLEERPSFQVLNIEGAALDLWLTRFQWCESKYPVKSPVRDITDEIQSQIARIDEELRVKMADYSAISHSVNAAERKRSGNLAVRDLRDVVNPSDFFESEHLTTLFVVVPKYEAKSWEGQYETLLEGVTAAGSDGKTTQLNLVVPRSSKVVYEDNESALWSVVVFKRVVDQFKLEARKKRFLVREYTYDKDNYVSGEEAHQDLVKELERQKNKLTRWCKANFTEAFIALAHLKAIRIHVESILRYGLPANYQAILMRPHKKTEKKLRKELEELFSHLNSGFGDGGGEEVVVPGAILETYYPYVFMDFNVDYSPK